MPIISREPRPSMLELSKVEVCDAVAKEMHKWEVDTSISLLGQGAHKVEVPPTTTGSCTCSTLVESLTKNPRSGYDQPGRRQ